MITLRFPDSARAVNSLLDFEREWQDHKDAFIEFPSNLSSHEVDLYLELAASSPELGVSQAILAFLSEAEHASDDALRKIFELGDVGARCSLVSRRELPVDVLEAAINDRDPNVRAAAAFNCSVSVETLRDMLSNPRNSSIVRSLSRAMQMAIRAQNP